MPVKKKRGVKPGTKRGAYKKPAIQELPSLADISDILNARASLRELVKFRIKQLNQLLKRI